MVVAACTGPSAIGNNEHQMFPGIVFLALAVFGAIKSWRTDASPAVITSVVLAVIGVVLSRPEARARSTNRPPTWCSAFTRFDRRRALP